ncbi:MAG: hypothetical protein J6P81_04530 [Spirochaetales bacterium]|nr:hypothetical protein [Spirochaetales bacterium]MBP5756431.1 hypothetical protein [Spirochaetales bacterium]
MNRVRFGFTVILIVMVSILFLVSCNADSKVCYYAYFEDCAYSIIYSQRNNSMYCIQLPLEQILLWGKASGMDSIPTAMKNYVGMKDKGFLIGTADSIVTVKEILDAMGSENEIPPSSVKRVNTLVSEAALLSKRPLLDKINQLCGQDVESLLKLLSDKNPTCRCYDAQSIFNTDDLNFSQRYFSQWLEQVLGG